MLLECSGLHVAYGGAQALRGAGLAVDTGQLVGLCGPNKAGKSALVRCIAGLKPYPRAGVVSWNGRDLAGDNPSRRLRLGISVCPEGRGIYPDLTVRQNFELGAGDLAGPDFEVALTRVLALFPELADRLRQSAGTLSGGEAQMLGISRKLMRDTRLLVLDEPSFGLAPKVVDRLLSTLSQLSHESRLAVLIVEEGIEGSLKKLERWAERCYVMSRGIVLTQGSPGDLIRQGVLEAGFMGSIAATSQKKSTKEDKWSETGGT